MVISARQFGHYRILNRIGAGGMGEVFLAEDSELNRKVALKILNNNLCANKEQLRRFKNEARAASALNHPNIVTIYEIGNYDKAGHYIAMEYVEGKTLRDMIARGEINLKDALDIAIQTASALAAAHDVGVIHRDIKPENIMLRDADGLVKILDFGLAKQTAAQTSLSKIDKEAVTQEKMDTAPGVVMGTVAYMSPEQARGKRMDARTDIWSLGVVLYEMITGKVPFTGETTTDVLAEILKNEPPTLSSFHSGIPMELEHIIKKTLGKNPENRYQVAKDLLLDLRIFRSELDSVLKISETGTIHARAEAMPTEVVVPLKTEITAKSYWAWLAIPVFLLLLILVFAFFWLRQDQTSDKNYAASLTSSQITTWKSELSGIDSSRARFSPDGKLIAFVASKDGKSGIWLKQIGGGEPFTYKQNGTVETSPIFSPDSGQLAFISERDGRRGVWQAPTLGGTPVLLSPLESRSRLVQWSKDGAAIYFEMQQNLYLLDIAGKQTKQLTDFKITQPTEHYFSVSPDEKRIVYSDRQEGQRDLWIANLNGENPVRITNDAAEDILPLWHPDGERIIYSSNRNGIKQICLAFVDGRSPVQITFSDGDSDVADISADGTKILYRTTKDDSDIWGINLDDNKEFQVTSDIGVELWQTVSPKDEIIAYQAAGYAGVSSKLFNSRLYSQKTGGGQNVLLASEGFAPQWSPTGNQMAFLRSDSGNINLWVVSAAGGDARAVTKGGIVFGGFTLLPFNRFQTQDFQWLPDESSIIYCARRNGISNVWKASADGAGETQITANEDKNEHFFNPVLSPDGKTLAWLVRSTDSQNKSKWSIRVFRDGKAEQVYQSELIPGLLGWVSENELLIKSPEAGSETSLQSGEINIFRLSLNENTARPVLKFKAYFQNIRLSPDRKTIGFVTRQDENDTIRTVSLDGTEKTVLSTKDARLYLSHLVWSPDSRKIYFGKQANWQIISSIDNFK